MLQSASIAAVIAVGIVRSGSLRHSSPAETVANWRAIGGDHNRPQRITTAVAGVVVVKNITAWGAVSSPGTQLPAMRQTLSQGDSLSATTPITTIAKTKERRCYGISEGTRNDR